jgi:hypothetical protein
MKRILFLLFAGLVNFGLLTASNMVEYASYDSPECIHDCFELEEVERSGCLETQLNYFTYRLVKSVYNYGKLAIYAGVWVNRYYKQRDETLFKKTFYDILASYNQSNFMGQIDYAKFNILAENILSKVDQYTNQTIEYEKYPSLACPVECTYDIATWKTIFGLSFSIFLLALVTTGIYSVYLHKQYKLIRNRLKKLNLNKQ